MFQKEGFLMILMRESGVQDIIDTYHQANLSVRWDTTITSTRQMSTLLNRSFGYFYRYNAEESDQWNPSEMTASERSTGV